MRGAVKENRQTLLVGTPRSASGSFTQFYHKFGVRSFHERMMVQGLKSELINTWHDTDDPAHGIRGLVRRWSVMLQDGLPYFEACHGKLLIVGVLSKLLPNLDFFVIARDPLSYLSSWKHMQDERLHGVNYLGRSMNEYADIAAHWGAWLLYQISLMEKKPIFLSFKRYIAGEYNEFLLDWYGLKTRENLSIAQEHLKTRFDHYGDYRILPVDEQKLKMCLRINAELERVCDEPRL